LGLALFEDHIPRYALATNKQTNEQTNKQTNKQRNKQTTRVSKWLRKEKETLSLSHSLTLSLFEIKHTELFLVDEAAEWMSIVQSAIEYL
jgi:hypothetical protein